MLDVYIPTKCKPCLIQDKYKFLYLTFVQHWTAIQIFPLLHTLFSYKALLMQDYYKTFEEFFSMTHMYFAKILQKNTLCLLDNTSDHHQSSLHNTQTREDIFQQMTQFMTYSLWLGSYFLVFRKMIIDTPCISIRGQKLRRHQHARMPLFTDMWIWFKYDHGLEIKYRHSRTLELRPPD